MRRDKGGKAFKIVFCDPMVFAHIVRVYVSLPRHADDVFSDHFSPLARIAVAM
jgi:hypothetical protein